jgi:hypothetical protein
MPLHRLTGVERFCACYMRSFAFPRLVGQATRRQRADLDSE